MTNKVEFSILAKDRFSKQFASLRKTINRTVKLAAGFGAAFAVGLGLAAKSIIKVGDTTESFRLRMNAMLGSVAEGNKVFKDMTEFAAQVPFAYENILESATQLSGILKGGSEEIKATMPLIADLATVSGLSIQKTTEQVSRMFSAGAASADLFRERGILAMIGFEAGVAISAEETKKKLFEFYNSATSGIKGASKKMAETWTGIMSMIGDKWFAMRSKLGEAGLFNFFKAIAMAINDLMGQALDNTKKNAISWSNTIIDSIRAIADATIFLQKVFHGLEVVWKGMEVVFSGVAVAIVGGLEAISLFIRPIINGWIQLQNLIGGTAIPLFESLDPLLNRIIKRTGVLSDEFSTLVMDVPGESIKNFTAAVEENFTRLQELSALANTSIVDTARAAAAEARLQAEQMAADYDEFLENMGLSTETFSEQFKNIMGNAVKSISNGIARVIVSGGNMAKVFQQIGKQVLTSLISLLIKMGIQRLAFNALNLTTLSTEAGAEGAKAVGLAIANGVASMAAAPFPINLGAPAFGASMGVAASSGMVAGGATGRAIGTALVAAHGGFTNVPKESTFLLDKGERVLSPNQNTDLTNFLNDTNEGSGSITIENINIISAEDFSSLDESNVDEFVASVVIPGLDRLDDSGVRPKAVERSI